MRGGPINTRRVTLEDPIKEVADLMESSKDEGWERSLTNKQVTFVVYRDGEQLNFFQVLDRGDGALTPLSESLSGGSVHNAYAEEDGASPAAAQQNLENSITMTKMKLLKAKMESMNLNKKKSAKVKPCTPVGPHPSSHLGSSSVRHHHRLFRSLSQINQPWKTNAPLPPIVDSESIDPSPPPAATPAHFTIPRRSPPSFLSPSCYMLQEEEPWETYPSFTKILPPPKVSRMEVGSKLMRDCVYPQLSPLCSRGPPEAPFDPAEPSAEMVGLSLLEEPVGLVASTQSGAPFGDFSDPLRLDVSIQHEGGRQPLDIGAQHQLPHPPSPISPWSLGTSDALTSRADNTSVHLTPPSPLMSPAPEPSPTRLLPQPFDSTLLLSNLQAQSSVKPGGTSPHPPASVSTHPLRRRGVKVESPGKRPEHISKREARSITKMANQACKEPLGSVNTSELLASLSTRTPDSSRDGLRESLGFALTLPPAATTSGQGSLGSRLPSIPTDELLQDDPIRQMSPMRRAASSYKTSNCFTYTGAVEASFGTIGLGHGGRCLSREAQTSLSPFTWASSSGGIPKLSLVSQETWSLHRVLGLPLGHLPVGRAQQTSPGRRPGGILTRCPSHLNWFLSAWVYSFTPSPSRITELLTPSLRESPDSLWKKLISAACTVYPQSHSFGHYLKLVTLGSQLSLHGDRLVQRKMHACLF